MLFQRSIFFQYETLSPKFPFYYIYIIFIMSFNVLTCELRCLYSEFYWNHIRFFNKMLNTFDMKFSEECLKNGKMNECW